MIERVDVDLFDPVPTNEPPRWRAGLPQTLATWPMGELRIVTADGHEGRAITNRGHVLKDLVDRWLRVELVGRDALDRELLWRRMWEVDRLEYLPTHMTGPVDVALWDLAARAAGMPLHRFLGSARDRIPAYASTATFGSVEEYLDVIDQCLAHGFRAIKLHAWGDARRDAQLAARVREHVGPDVPLMYDGSAAFDVADAVYLGDALHAQDYLWYEEPIQEYSIAAYRSLAAKTRAPLLVAEVSAGAHMNTADFISAVSPAYVRTSAGFRGGVTGAMRIAHLADAFRIRAEVHGGGPVSRHLCLAISNTTYYESLVLSNPVIPESVVDRDGYVTAPKGPGVGWGQTA